MCYFSFLLNGSMFMYADFIAGEGINLGSKMDLVGVLSNYAC